MAGSTPGGGVRVEEIAEEPEGENVRLMYQNDAKTVYRSKTWNERLHVDDLVGPFFVSYFVAAWIFIIYTGISDSWTKAAVYIAIMVALNLLCLALKNRNPMLKGARYLDEKVKWY